jgi:hypothetical protein
MSKISSLSGAATFQVIRQGITAALEPIVNDWELGMKIGKITYERDGSSATIQIQLGTKAADGTVVTTEANAFKQLAPMYGMKAEWLHQEFDHPFNRGVRYKIIGLRTKARKNPVIVKDVRSGKDYIVPEQMVITAMSKVDREAATAA